MGRMSEIVQAMTDKGLMDDAYRRMLDEFYTAAFDCYVLEQAMKRIASSEIADPVGFARAILANLGKKEGKP